MRQLAPNPSRNLGVFYPDIIYWLEGDGEPWFLEIAEKIQRTEYALGDYRS